MPGRPHKPTLIHKIEGTGRASRLKLRANEVRPSDEPLVCPDWLSAESRIEWDRLLSNGGYAKAFNSTHQSWLAIYCHMYGEVVRAARAGEHVSSERLKAMATYMSKLGMNPCDAVKVHTQPEEKPADPWAALG